MRHHGELHAPARHVEGVGERLRGQPGARAADQLELRVQLLRVVLLGRELRDPGQGCHLEAVEDGEGGAGVGDHAHAGGDNAAIEAAEAALLGEDLPPGVQDALVPPVVGCLEG